MHDWLKTHAKDLFDLHPKHFPNCILIYGDKERAGASSSSSEEAPLLIEKRISDVPDNANGKALEEILRFVAESNEGDQSHEVKRPKVMGRRSGG